MNIFAPLVVYFKINWPKAYYFFGKMKFIKLKKFRSQLNSNPLVIKEIENQTIDYFRTIVDRTPALINMQDWLDTSGILGCLYFLQGRMEELNGVCQKRAEVQGSMAKVHQFNDLEIEFLPKYLSVGSIGNYEHLDIYVKAMMLSLRPSKKLILLVDPNVSVNNTCYLNYWSSYITVIRDPLLVEMLSPLQARFAIPLNWYIFLREKMHKSFLALGIVREQWIRDSCPPILKLLDEDYERGWKCLKSFGMQHGDWFVCVHVRESGWKDNGSSAEDFRNADINTYTLAMKTITEAGGWVIRMGDPTMKPLPEMHHVIDYAHSTIKSDWMDVFLCAQCRFFIATSSGLFTFAMTFGNPVVMTNLLPTCGAYYLTSNDLFLPRICRSKEENRLLDFRKLFSPSIGTAAVQSNYDKENIEIIANTEEDIRDLIEEMLERCNGRLVYSEEDERLQNIFSSVTTECGKQYGEEGAVVNARLGRNFLRKYGALLSTNENSPSFVNVK